MGSIVFGSSSKITNKNIMKVLASLLPLAFADFAQIKNDVVSMVANSSMRGFTGQIGQQVDLLNEYGCWCYFYNDHGRGKGQPVDESDGFCKTLHEGYDCAIRDAEDRGDACTPWEVAYVSGINQNAGLPLLVPISMPVTTVPLLPV